MDVFDFWLWDGFIRLEFRVRGSDVPPLGSFGRVCSCKWGETCTPRLSAGSKDV